jgi:predicted nicotinamide N-methyase
MRIQSAQARALCSVSQPAGWGGASVRTLRAGDATVRVRQHFFDRPVPQPRTVRPKADLTGMKVWPVSLRILSQLCDPSCALLRRRGGSPSAAPLRVLELGAGVGLLGLALAAARADVSVLLTDPGVEVHFEDGVSNTLDWLRANVAANADATRGRASAGQLLWGCGEHLEQISALGPFDLVLGSDLLYDPDMYPALRSTLDALVGEGGVAVLGFTSRLGTESRFLTLAAERFAVETTWHQPRETADTLWATAVLTRPPQPPLPSAEGEAHAGLSRAR